ncbi:tryptophanase [Salinarchaeum laminariae]|uniref:tryptophanase n=1 Tax=Salinarchaeum laminariae TaxID=869888 RepID=UPI0020C0CDA0|nr:tryptophanase [Salinarchaeum laminariae]
MYESRMVDRATVPDQSERERILAEAGYNVFNVPADAVAVDLLTDSGTGTMSTEQWAALLRGDEAYAGSRSFGELEDAVSDVMGFDRIVPAHQGRGAEHVLYGAIVEDGDVVPNNTHFDTTRAHVTEAGGTPIDCPVPGAMDPDASGEFLGNLDVEAARDVAAEHGPERIPAIVVTVTNNAAAGQPVSIENVRAARQLADDLDARLVIDACRFAENAYFVSERDPECQDASIEEITRELLGYADAFVMSGKKDGLANVGGFVAVADGENDLFAKLKQRAILYEGFPTYGGMAGRDMAAMAVGLREAVERSYLEHRIGQVRELGQLLEAAGVPIYRPIGGHAVYVDAAAALPSVPAEKFPGQTLVCAAYREGAIRTVELGSFAFPDTDRPELVRLAVPRRTYHQEHFERVADAFGSVLDRADQLGGLEVVTEPERASLRHFSARLEPVDAAFGRAD